MESFFHFQGDEKIVDKFPKNLRVNADDFGLDPRISAGILDCIEKGLIHSFSVVQFTDEYHDRLLKDIIAKYPWIKIGVHLNFLSQKSIAKELTEQKNHFLEFLKLYVLGEFPEAKIYEVWKNQIEFLGKYLGGNEKISHLDSHQHLHLLPGLWAIAEYLQGEYRIQKLRIPYEGIWQAAFFRFPFGLAMQILAGCIYFRSKFFWGFENLGPIFEGANSEWTIGLPLERTLGRPLRSPPSRLIGFFTSTSFNFKSNYLAFLMVKNNPKIQFELMVHPALNIYPNISSDGKIQFNEVEELEKVCEFFREGILNGKDKTPA